MTARPSGPDARLHAMRRESADIQRRWLVDLTDQENDALSRQKWRVSWEAANTPARTPEGLRSKAAVVLDLLLGGYATMDMVVDGDTPEDIQIVIAILREIVGGAVCPTLATATDDADLVADCRAFDALQLQIHAIHGAEPKRDAERDRLGRRQAPLVERIVEATAATPAGHAARARSLLAWSPELVGPGAGDTGQRLLHALLRDIAGAEAVAAACAMLGDAA